MESDPTEHLPTGSSSASAGSLLARYAWLPYVLPMAVFLIGTSLEPKPPGEPVTSQSLLEIPYAYYPWVYVAKIALTVGAMAVVWPLYRSIRWRVSPWALLIGAIGTGVWVGLCSLEIESRYLPAWLVGSGKRSAFNPLSELSDHPGMTYTFLAVRFFGLAIVVPVIEEFFLRGFLTRYLAADEWEKAPLGRAPLGATLITIAAAALMHPAELVAALVWFSSITVLYYRTGRLADAIAAHSATNLLLGLYVVGSGAWHFL